MLGIATYFQILDLTQKRLAAAPQAELQTIAKIMAANQPYAFLGAIGPSLADFLPSEPPPSGPSVTSSNWYTALWNEIFDVIGGDGTAANPGLLAVLTKFRAFLNKIVPIANAEDLGALKAMKDDGEVDDITNTATALKNIVTTIPLVAAKIAAGIGTGLKPGLDVAVGAQTPPPVTWTTREFLYWKRPGSFTSALVNAAENANDDRFRAYAYGYLISYAANVVGSSFVNSSVGGAYRSQWWRQRWINNYVDTWVYGYYAANAAMAGDTPNPTYDKWPGLCNAQLQKKIALAAVDPNAVMTAIRSGQELPAALPPEFGTFWMNAWQTAYGPPPLGSRFKAEFFNGAFVMTWMALWFQTSGDVIGCNPAPPMSPPSDCGGQPSWVDPTVPGDNGSGSTPPSPSVKKQPDVGEIVTGVILALLGAATMAFGGLIPGGVAIAVGVGKIIEGANQIDWAKLRCDLYWYQMYLYNGVKALHNILTMGGFTHPYPAELAMDQTVLNFLGIQYTFDSGKKNVKSQRLIGHGDWHVDPTGEYPSKPWSGALGTWPQRPTASDPGFEQPETIAYLAAAYPTFFIDDDAQNPLANGDVKTGAGWPPGSRLDPATRLPVQFGNAVANAVDLFQHLGTKLPEWNLDADRSLASLTWHFAKDTYTDPVQIEAEP